MVSRSSADSSVGSVDITTEFSPLEPRGNPVGASSVGDSPSTNRRISLVEGSGLEITGELHTLLQSRLRIAALLLLSAFVLFLVRNAIFYAGSEHIVLRKLFGPHVLTTLMLAASSFLLCARCRVSPVWLRVHESLVFGLPAIVFLMLQYYDTPLCAARGYIANPAPGWLLLIFTYAMFIPNTVTRGGLVIVVFAIAPVILMFVQTRTDAACREVLTSGSNVPGTLPLIMAVAASTSIVGLYRIGSLRTEAFRARQLGQYTLRRQLGSGGMGEVYLAEHEMMKRPCAVKIIRPEKAGDPRVLARFEREVRATAKLSHWHTVEIYDYGHADDGTFYYVMEYLPGLSLQELIDQYGPLPPARAIYFLRDVCEALAEAHDTGLIHRDIKPANIFAAQRGGVYDVTKLLDFGLARPLLSDTNQNHTEVTQLGTVTGSPLYMAPEAAIDDQATDARGDIYSLGATAFFLLTGRPPFAGQHALQVLADVIHKTAPTIREIDASLPEDLSKVIGRCLAKSPSERFANVRQVIEALNRCQDAHAWNRQRAAQWWEKAKHPAAA
ncbi:MAG: serine/threonine-protein kinase [Pirellulaceae bacterium]|nr:serine/threonine protein kinase [Planctomycetales bacterium]